KDERINARAEGRDETALHSTGDRAAGVAEPMTDGELQFTRDFILMCASRYPRGLTSRVLDVQVASRGIELEKTGANSLEAQIEYLIGAGLLARKPKAHTASLETFSLTPAGDDYLRQNKLLQ